MSKTRLEPFSKQDGKTTFLVDDDEASLIYDHKTKRWRGTFLYYVQETGELEDRPIFPGQVSEKLNNYEFVDFDGNVIESRDVEVKDI